MNQILAARPSKLEIAVIGGGIAGMSAAWLLNQKHNVTLYEREGRVGGHTNTVTVQGPDGPIPVDTGFIVYNEVNYPNLVALFGHLKVPTEASDMSFAVSIDDGDMEYTGTGLLGLFAQPANMVKARFWKMLRDLVRFYREGPSLLFDKSMEHLSLGEYLTANGYCDAFIDDHLLPMAAAIWSTPSAQIRKFPARFFIRFCVNHGLMRFAKRPAWRTVSGGSREYVRRLTAGYADRILTNAPVSSIRRVANGVLIADGSGRLQFYDHVVIAAHADDALSLITDPSPEESAYLGAFAYTRNHAVLHSDPSLMPKRRSVWSSWNSLRERGGDRGCSVTYWMNRLQNLDPRLPLFLSLNPASPPDPASVHRSFIYTHPVFDHAAMDAQRLLWRLQGVQNTWFCGSYFGFGFHEDALQSGLAVAEALGEMRRPWRVSGENDRLLWPATARSPVSGRKEAA